MMNLLNYYRYLFSDNKQWFVGTVALFVAMVGMGMLFFSSFPQLIEVIFSGFEEQFGSNPELNFDLAMKIFFQNMLASGIGLIGGAVLGLTSLLVIAVNGLVIGYIMAWVWNGTENALTAIVFLSAGLVPHGIFEIPAFLIAAGLGLRLGWEWMGESAKGRRWSVFKANLKRVVFCIPGIALVLFVAALIEVFFTGWLVEKL